MRIRESSQHIEVKQPVGEERFWIALQLTGEVAQFDWVMALGRAIGEERARRRGALGRGQAQPFQQAQTLVAFRFARQLETSLRVLQLIGVVVWRQAQRFTELHLCLVRIFARLGQTRGCGVKLGRPSRLLRNVLQTLFRGADIAKLQCAVRQRDRVGGRARLQFHDFAPPIERHPVVRTFGQFGHDPHPAGAVWIQLQRAART